MSKQFWGLVVVIVLVLVGVFIFTGRSSKTASNSVAGVTNHVEGKATSGVKIVEYGDYQCPYCEQYYSTVKQVQAQYGDQISIQFRNFPLTSIHQNAFAAARAAEAAGKQNKYFEMHDMLYQNNDPSGASGWVASSTPTTYFNQYATQLGLNLTQFKTDYASEAVNSAINADTAAGTKLGVEGTPTFFVNGKKVQIGNTAANFKTVIDAAIASTASGDKAATPSSGTTSQTQK